MISSLRQINKGIFLSSAWGGGEAPGKRTMGGGEINALKVKKKKNSCAHIGRSQCRTIFCYRKSLNKGILH